MAIAVVTVASGGLPVVDVTATTPALGLPVTETTNGIPVTKVTLPRGGLPVTFVSGGGGGGDIGVLGDRLVFGYYFMATSTYGINQASYANDIADAQALGIDGFAVAAGGWSTETFYITWFDAMFAAAQAAALNADGTKFKLFVSAEVGGALTPADVKDMVNRYKGTAPGTPTGVSNTNYYWHGGKPFLTTSDGSKGSGADSAAGLSFWNSVFSGGFQASFYPAFTTMRPTGGQVDTNCPTYAQIRADWDTWWKTTANGLCYFQFDGMAINSDGSKGALTISAEAYAQIMREDSRLFLSGLNSFYALTKFTTEFMLTVERYGCESLAAQWASVIDTQRPQWVIFDTWNDINETYITPCDPANITHNTDPDVNTAPYRYSHLGLAKFHAPYITQYKTGVFPAITKDEVFYSYRTQPAALTPPATSFTASIAGTTLTVSAIASGYIHPGKIITGSGVTSGTTVRSQTSGTPGGVGVYVLWQSQTVSSRTMTGIAVTTAFFNLEDKIYVTTKLTAPATLRVISGGVTTDTSVAAGIVHTRVPFNTGVQKVQLIRASTTLIDLTGDPILSAINYYNHNPTTGWGDYPSSAPAWWEPAALYDFDFIHQRGRDVAGAANIAVGSFSSYFSFANGAPRYSAAGLLIDGTVTFDHVRLGGALATLTSGDNVCIMVEVDAAVANINKRIFASGTAGSGDMAPDSNTVLGSYNTVNFMTCTLGNSKGFSTHNVRCMYRQTAAGRAICAGGGTVTSDANKAAAGRAFWIGSQQGTAGWWEGSIRRIQIFDPATVTNANMTTYTTGETT